LKEARCARGVKRQAHTSRNLRPTRKKMPWGKRTFVLIGSTTRQKGEPYNAKPTNEKIRPLRGKGRENTRHAYLSEGGGIIKKTFTGRGVFQMPGKGGPYLPVAR